ncbi:MAG TPA: hypothetical protein VK139_06315 [Microbacteriaceae bacterium]|nr:hypothetical protein [Microbacteriaceae bacterium]
MRTRENLSRRKVRAIVAMTSVIGVGAVITLAAWSATSFLQSDVKTGKLAGMKVSVNAGTSWSPAGSSSSPAILDLGTVPASPNSTTYSLFGVQAAATTTVDFPVKLTASIPTGYSGSGLSYTIAVVSTPACSASTPGTDLFAYTSVTATAPTQTFDVKAPTVAGNDGAPTWVCLKIKADKDILENATQRIDWTLTAGW